MKILIVSQYYWPESFRINDVALALKERGCEVSVLTGQPNYPEGETFSGYKAWKAGRYENAGIAIFRVPLFPRGSSSAWRLAANYMSFIVMGCLFAPALLRRQEFDIILVFGMSPILQAIPAVLLKTLRRKPLVTWVQDLWPESLRVTGYVRNERVLKWVGVVVNWIYRRNDLLLVQSRAFIEKIQPVAGHTPIAYHPNPGDSLPVLQDDFAPGVFALDGSFNVVFAGNLGSFQSLDTLLDAAELLRGHRGVRFILIGSGSRRSWLEHQLRMRKIDNVQLCGRVEPAKIPPILAQASVLLVSLSRSPIMALTIPSKIQTYLACGRPIIGALDGEGARVILEAEAGIACVPDDARSLADAVLTMREATPEERRRMGENGRRYYGEHFSPPLLTTKLLQHLQSLCARQTQSTEMTAAGEP